MANGAEMMGFDPPRAKRIKEGSRSLAVGWMGGLEGEEGVGDLASVCHVVGKREDRRRVAKMS